MKQHIKTVKEFTPEKMGELGYWIKTRRAIEEVVKAAERYELVRTLGPTQFMELWQRSISGKGAFDDLVDKMIEARK